MQAVVTRGSATRRSHRGRRVAGIVVVLIALLVGAAIAFFIARQTFANNTVSSGSLKVTAEGLPLDFGGKTVYPTSAKNPSYTVKDEFKVTNSNPVSVGYLLSASCSECGASGSKRRQFDNLYVRITPMGSMQVPPPGPVFEGRLADLKSTSLGTLGPNTSRAFSVELWLADTPNEEQAQNVKTLFELVVSARTPPVSAQGTASSSPGLPTIPS